MPTARQVLGAQIRAEQERWEKKHRVPCKGGYEIPPRAERYAHLAKTFNMTPVEVSYFLTWSRSCTHTWESGACDDCPE